MNRLPRRQHNKLRASGSHLVTQQTERPLKIFHDQRQRRRVLSLPWQEKIIPVDRHYFRRAAGRYRIANIIGNITGTLPRQPDTGHKRQISLITVQLSLNKSGTALNQQIAMRMANHQRIRLALLPR